MENKLPLQVSHTHQTHANLTKINFLLYFISLVFVFYYRFVAIFHGEVPALPWLLITMSELLLSFFWICAQAYRWRPVSRTVFPDRLPSDEKLPAIDVFVFTCDPKKEPTIGVMNTVISAMCLDYPPEKISVYLSDDGGAPITLFAAREAYKFAKKWVPFCRKYRIKTIAAEAYFSKSNHEEHDHRTNTVFLEDLEDIKIKYGEFKRKVEKAIESDEISKDRPALIEVLNNNEPDEVNRNVAQIPLLVYVSREKRPTHHHHFKAGAINVLLRVSGMISNAPFLLTLDCDMYCNDPMSAREAMCLHLDPQISHSLAFVQFPQCFHNLSKNDIYNAQLRTVFKSWYYGLCGLMGPFLSGTCFYLRREALYKTSPREEIDPSQAKIRFGWFDEFVTSTYGERNLFPLENEVVPSKLIDVASCTFEEDTQWGEQIGFSYKSVIEDFLTGMFLHCKGWISVYYDPARPAFLGSGHTNLNDTLTQNTRWSSGLLQVGLSRFCPLIYAPSQVPILQSMAYSISLQPLNFFIVLCHSIVPQFCLLNGITLYPKVSDPWFGIFVVFYVSSPFQQILEVLATGGSIRLFWNEQRLWFMKGATSNLLAFLDILKKLMGMKEIDFNPTNKSSKEKEIQKYQMDIFDFDIDSRFLLILATISCLNIVSLAVGIGRVIVQENFMEMFGQISLSHIILLLIYPVIEALLFRKDEGRIPKTVLLLSLSLVFIVYHIGFFLV
ncbi:hypothetical protein ACHQM5_014402 [Ranunculus cassubicifolius]